MSKLRENTKGFPDGTSDKESTCQCRRCKRYGFDPWVKKIPWRKATHSSILAYRIPLTEEPGWLQSIGLQRVGHDWSTLAKVSGSMAPHSSTPRSRLMEQPLFEISLVSWQREKEHVDSHIGSPSFCLEGILTVSAHLSLVRAKPMSCQLSLMLTGQRRIRVTDTCGQYYS